MATKTLTCLAYRPDKTVPSPYNFIVGIDSSTSIYYTNGTVINSSVGALACAYSQTLDFFATGGTNKNLTIFNATSNTSDSAYVLSNKIQSMDFSNDGVFLAVGVSDGSINILTQNCNSKCDVSLYFDLTNNACTPCGIPLLGCVTCYNSGTCKYCSQSYYLAQNKTCLPCYSTMPGCSTCSSNVSCTSPLPGYYIIANGNTSLC
jgi:WD40 repeat protein